MEFILFLGILLLLGLASSRVMKLVKLPNVTGYLIVGLLCALLCIFIDNTWNTEFSNTLNTMNSFVSTIALGFIALSIGEEFKLSKLKQYGKNIVIITLLQALLAVLFVDITLFIVCLLLHISTATAIALGAIATATAPAATLMVINQYKAKGELVDILLPVVAFDDAIGLIVFSISISISSVIATGSEISFLSICVIPLIEIIGSIVLGCLLGVIMHFVIKFFKSRNNHEVTIIAFTLLGVGLCELLNNIKMDNRNLEFSNLLTCMMIGAVFVNIAKDSEKTIVDRDFDLMSHWTPFLFMLFFVLSGTHLVTSAKEIILTQSVSMLLPIVLIFITYIVFRSLGKYFGAFLGAEITGQNNNIKHYLGITLLPQAGVAIGMANTVSKMPIFETGSIGNIIVTVVLCATLVYEIIGPLLTKWSLVKTGEIDLENL